MVFALFLLSNQKRTETIGVTAKIKSKTTREDIDIQHEAITVTKTAVEEE